MRDANAPQISIELVTGKLDLHTDSNVDINEFCDFAARANPKRGFLIVSKVLGRHLPATPRDMRMTMNDIAKRIPSELPEPVVFLGMAETATALGQGVFAGYQANNPGKEIVYLQSTRQLVEGAELIASFEEGHSHASTHLIQVLEPALVATIKKAETLVIVDDECSTGKTYLAATNAMRQAMPNMQLVANCCITDWSGKAYIKNMPLPTVPVSIVSGIMDWAPGTFHTPATLATGTNEAGTAPRDGMRSRSGLSKPEAANRQPITVKPGERILVLGDGEHSYEALLVAEEIEEKGGIAGVQCITRSPALVGGAMASKSVFTDSYGSGAPCFLYNMNGHKPDRIIIVAEIAGTQASEAVNALRELGVIADVELLKCTYGDVAEAKPRVKTVVDGDPIVMTDLDDTLFQTRRKISPDAQNLKLMSVLVDGSPSGYATIQQQNLLKWFQNGAVIPVTARSSDVFQRVDLPMTQAICSNGGCIINADGTFDMEWHQKLIDAASKDVSVSDLFEAFTYDLCRENFRCWVISENSLENYFVIKSNKDDVQALAELEKQFSDRLPSNWRCHRNGNNLAYLPPWLSKRHAARYLIEKYRSAMPSSPIIGVGDSSSDVGFMDLCDFAMAPTKTQLWKEVVADSKWVSE